MIGTSYEDLTIGYIFGEIKFVFVFLLFFLNFLVLFRMMRTESRSTPSLPRRGQIYKIGWDILKRWNDGFLVASFCYFWSCCIFLMNCFEILVWCRFGILKSSGSKGFWHKATSAKFGCREDPAQRSCRSNAVTSPVNKIDIWWWWVMINYLYLCDYCI